MSKDRADIDEKEMRRYLNNEMNREERYAFEKKLEKDPFAYEAVQGMEQFDPKDITSDLNDIRRQMQPWRRKPVMMWKIAAVIALMVMAGVSAWRLTTDEPNGLATKSETATDSTIALNDTPAEKETDEEPLPAVEDTQPETLEPMEELPQQPATSSAAGAGIAEGPAPATVRTEVAEQIEMDMVLDADEAVAAESEDLEAELEVLVEEVVAVEEQVEPEPEAAKEMEDEMLADQVITEAPVSVAADDMAEKSAAEERSASQKKTEADYRSQLKATGAVSRSVGPANPQLASPDMGWEAFEKYIRNNQQREKEIVRGIVSLSFVIDETGSPSNIEVITSLCEPCDNEAVRLLKNSGRWTYYEGTTGTPVTSVSIQLRR